MKKIEVVFLTLILFLGFSVRLYRFDNPIADWHSWRQADTSSVSRYFSQYGFDLLHPKYHDLSSIPSKKENPNGYRFVEFPIYNFFQAAAFKYINLLLPRALTISLEGWGRLVSIFSSLLSAVFLYFLVKKYMNVYEAMFSSFFFLFLPFSIFYGRTILPDEMMVTTILGGVFFFDQWLEKFEILNPKLEANSKFKIQNQVKLGQDLKLQPNIKNHLYFILAIVLTASSFLLKPYALFFTLPMVYLAWGKFGLSFLKKWQLWLFVIVSILPLVFWRIWIQQYPEGIPASSWLFNDGDIRFKGSFFYWIFGERISRLILGYFGVSLLFLGVFRKSIEKEYYFVVSFILSSLLYLFVIAAGNVRHDYYQILIIPTMSILLGRGVSFLLYVRQSAGKYFSYAIIFIITTGMFSFSWYYVRDYFNINNWGMVYAGRQADKILPKDAKVIAAYGGDTSFLYQTGRNGWPVFDKPIEEMIERGAEYMVVANPTQSDFDGFGKMFPVVSSSSSYLILKLE